MQDLTLENLLKMVKKMETKSIVITISLLSVELLERQNNDLESGK